MTNDISKPQHCDTKDMLRFLFSFCSAKAGATEVEPKDRDILVAFKKVQSLANKRGTDLRANLSHA